MKDGWYQTDFGVSIHPIGQINNRLSLSYIDIPGVQIHLAFKSCLPGSSTIWAYDNDGLHELIRIWLTEEDEDVDDSFYWHYRVAKSTMVSPFRDCINSCADQAAKQYAQFIGGI